MCQRDETLSAGFEKEGDSYLISKPDDTCVRHFKTESK